MEMIEQKLYKVTLRGMKYNCTGIIHGVSYVVAADAEEAYQKVKRYLDKKDYGFKEERELEKIELLSSTYEYNHTKTLLFL